MVGDDLTISLDKSYLILSLKEFELHYNPLYLWLLRLKITSVRAKEFAIDARHYTKTEAEPSQVKFPKFLKHIKLKEALIENFSWLQPGEKLTKVDNITLTSRFGSTIHTSPLNLKAEKIEHSGPKLDIFVDAVDIDGFFLFDFSKPHFFDESKLSATARIDGTLIAPFRTPKPWLKDLGYDPEMGPLLNKYYGDAIPENRTFVFFKNIYFSFYKTKKSLLVNSLKINLFDSYLIGNGQWDRSSQNLKAKLNSESPLSLSKLPLGQSKFRKSFDNFSIDLNLDGKLNNFKEHSLSFDLKTKLMGNFVNPSAGDATAHITGNIDNTILKTNSFTIEQEPGLIQGNARFDLKSLTVDADLSAKDMDGQTVLRLFSSVNIPAVITATGKIAGKINNPKIALDMMSENAAYEFLNFGRAKGTLAIEDQNMVLHVASQDSDVGLSELNMDVKSVFKTINQHLKLESSFHEINIKKLLNSENLDGMISGNFDLTRIIGKVNATGNFKAKELTYFEHGLGAVDFTTTLKEKHLEVKPIVFSLAEPQRRIENARGLSFDFDDAGYTFSGNITEELPIKAQYLKNKKDTVFLQLTPQKMNLDLFAPLIPFSFSESHLSGKIEINYNTQEPVLSDMKSAITELDITTPDGKFLLNKPGGLDYNDKAFVLKNLDLAAGNGTLFLNGAWGLTNNSNLTVRGNIDFTPLTDFNPFISESLTPVTVDITLRDDIHKPLIYGRVDFKDNTISFRKVETELENLNGAMKFEGQKITTEKLSFIYDDSPITLQGFLSTDYEKILAADLKITGRETPLHSYEGIFVLADIDFALTGQNTLTLSGNVNILEGNYQRNFSITNFIISPTETLLEEDRETFAGLPLNTNYHIKIINTGDLTIKSNIAQLELSADLTLLGTIEHPSLIGQLDFLDGQINAFGIMFDEAEGYAQFMQSRGVIPEVSLNARKEIQNYTVTARIDGNANNLRLRLSSIPALDHREILSVVFYGATSDQLDDEYRRSFTTTVALSQLASILSDPLNRVSGIDVLQVTSRRESTLDTVQRIKVGKHLSQRFNVSFTTDLNVNDPERAFELRYQVFDNFYLLAAKDIVDEARYRFDLSFNIEAY